MILDCGEERQIFVRAVSDLGQAGAYRMEINIAYENGDTDFGGNQSDLPGNAAFKSCRCSIVCIRWR